MRLGIEITSMTDGQKIPMSWVMLEKHSNKEGSAQKSFMIKWKWFIWEHGAKVMEVAAAGKGGLLCFEQVASFPLGSSLELPELTSTWTCPMDSSQRNHTELHALWMVVSRGKDGILFGKGSH